MSKSYLFLALVVVVAVGAIVLVYAQPERPEKAAGPAPATEAEILGASGLPPAVLAAAEKAFGKTADFESESHLRSGAAVYELEADKDGREVSILVNADGEVLEEEREIAFEDLPQAIQDKLKAAYPEAVFTEAEEILADGIVAYEAECELDGREIEIQISAEGDLSEEIDDESGDDED